MEDCLMDCTNNCQNLVYLHCELLASQPGEGKREREREVIVSKESIVNSVINHVKL